KRVYVQAAAGDAGGAIGAAVQVWHQLSGQATARPQPKQIVLAVGAARSSCLMDHAYWGPQFTNHEIASMLESHTAELGEQGCTIEVIEDEQELCQRTADAVAAGRVVGWFQGRMEWGPRALGNRSIVCDPRRADMKDILNRKIKRRESFRPFAP